MLSKVRSLVQQYSSQGLYDSALFWADKALSLSTGDPNDLATYAQALYHCGQYQRAIRALHASPFLPQSPALKYLAGKCHAACKEWGEVIGLLSPQMDEFSSDSEQETVECPALGDVQSASLVLQGVAYEGLGNLHDAVNLYREALMVDVFCAEALERLATHHSLSSEEKKSLLANMPFKNQCSVEEERMLKFLYQTKLQQKQVPDSSQVHESLKPLCSNSEVQCSAAEQHFQSMNIDTCFRLTSEILEKDPYNNPALLLHVACCMQKGRAEDLFSLGHQLVNYFPNSPHAWYTVGCYYLTTSRHQSARKYLTKAITLNSHFAPAHMAFGVSFATEGEHDQAIAAFSNAAKVMKGSHLPLMHLGREYYHTGATSISTRFMKSALALAPRDPSVLQEIGVMLANSGNYAKAEKYFHQAIVCLQVVDPHITLQAWEPVYNNLGHVYRKQKKYDLALKTHTQALQLSPNEPTTLTAIAFAHLLQGSHEKCVDYCNRSLRVKREDQFTIELLRAAMEEIATLPGVEWGPVPESLDVLGPGNETEQSAGIETKTIQQECASESAMAVE